MLSALVVRLRPVVHLTDDQLYEFARLNRELRIERNARGELIVMPPTGGETGSRNAEIIMQLRLWTKRDGRGVSFDSATGFRLPNAAVRSPDAAWLDRARWAALTAEQRKKFIPLCPEFVIELCSESDELKETRKKMQEYLDNGACLGWLLDPAHRRVYIYRPRRPVEILNDPDTVAGEPPVSGFVLDLREIW